MSDANVERGEIAVELDGRPYVLRPSYAAQVAIETLTGRSIEQLAMAAGNGSLTIEQAGVIVCECIKAEGETRGDAKVASYRAERIAELIVEAGKMRVAKRIELLLYLAATGGYRASGEPRPLPKPPAKKPAGDDTGA